ncbi:MFS transporter [Teichococcus vastitatis]|uniref:MFS transporter n=1 Tax=Teichococcus vastitatis TaxID=2307076 RepID=A0ABS9W3W0_9PROT|nr:MFS transporter [Pseudoroseomonas vastitatis]MCI0753967.1 MFS transporter [Pseudoroseomonas vastitatis]
MNPDSDTPPPAHPGRHRALIGAVFAAIGASQPFLPAYLLERGLAPGEVSLVLALGAAIRILAGPLGGRLADGLGNPRLLLVLLGMAAALAAGGFTLAAGLLGFLLAQLALNAAMAPMTPLADAICLAAARRSGFEYGRLRVAGSITYMAMAVLAGWLAGRFGLSLLPGLMAAALASVAVAALALPRPPDPAARAGPRGGMLMALRLPGFTSLLLLSGLIQSSHAAYYAFSTIHWSAAGHAPATIGLLWAVAVLGEIALFLHGHRLVRRLGPAGMAMLAAAAGLLRWGSMATTTWLPALLLIQLLHALSFGAQHLAAMQLIQRLVPPALASTAQSLHSALGVGLLMGLMTWLSGPLYAAWGGGVFLLMATLCALALPLALWLRGM